MLNFLLCADAHEQMSFSRRKRIRFDRGETWIRSTEDYVITKLQWAKRQLRGKDIEDVRGVPAVQQGKLDPAYIRHWCDQHGTRDLLEKTLHSIPPLPNQ